MDTPAAPDQPALDGVESGLKPGSAEWRAAKQAEGREAQRTAAKEAREAKPPVPVVEAEIVSAPKDVEPTRTALKRAMRARAQEYAERAIEVLAKNLNSADAKLAQGAANDILAWAFGKPATEIEAGDGTQVVLIRRFGDNE